MFSEVETVLKIEKWANIPFVERRIAKLPDSLRWPVANYRYKEQFNQLKSLQTGHDGQMSLLKTEQFRTIFVHVPKTAGVSISRSLFGGLAASHTPLFLYLALYTRSH